MPDSPAGAGAVGCAIGYAATVSAAAVVLLLLLLLLLLPLPSLTIQRPLAGTSLSSCS
jgi:hypothetical protein